MPATSSCVRSWNSFRISVARCLSGRRPSGAHPARVVLARYLPLGSRPGIDERLVELARLWAAPRAEVEARVDGDPVEPCRERALAAKAPDRPPRLQEHFLRQVVGVLVVVHVAIAQPVDGPLVALHKHVEGLALAALRCRDRVPLASRSSSAPLLGTALEASPGGNASATLVKRDLPPPGLHRPPDRRDRQDRPVRPSAGAWGAPGARAPRGASPAASSDTAPP